MRPLLYVWLVVGVIVHLYSHALGALLVTECRSFYPPFRSDRCAVPLIANVSGAALAIGCGLALVIRRRK